MSINNSQLLYSKIFLLLEISYEEKEFSSYFMEKASADVGFSNIISTLTEFNIAHVVARSDSVIDNMLPLPSLALVKKRGSNSYFLLKSCEQEVCSIYNPNIDEFITTYKSIILSNVDPWIILLEKTPISKFYNPNRDFKSNKRSLTRNSLLAIAVITICLLVWASYFWLSFTAIVYLWASLIGFVASIALWRIKAFTKHQGLISHLCSVVSGDNSCDVALSSQYGKIFGIDLPYIGVLHFSFTLALMLQYTFGYSVDQNSEFGAYLYLVYTMCGGLVGLLLFILQLNLFDKLCILCTAVVISLVVQAIVFYNFISNVAVIDIFTIPVALLISLSVYTLLKLSHLRNSFDEVSLSYNSLLDNQQLFSSVSAQPNGYLRGEVSSKHVLINYSSTATSLIELIIIEGCKHCKDFLQSMVEVVLLTEEYNLSIKLHHSSDSSTSPGDCGVGVVDDYLAATPGLMSLCLVNKKRPVSSGMCIKDLCGESRNDDICEYIISHKKAESFPYIRVNGKMLPMIYTADQLKKHLIALKYNT